MISELSMNRYHQKIDKYCSNTAATMEVYPNGLTSPCMLSATNFMSFIKFISNTERLAMCDPERFDRLHSSLCKVTGFNPGIDPRSLQDRLVEIYGSYRDSEIDLITKLTLRLITTDLISKHYLRKFTVVISASVAQEFAELQISRIYLKFSRMIESSETNRLETDGEKANRFDTALSNIFKESNPTAAERNKPIYLRIINLFKKLTQFDLPETDSAISNFEAERLEQSNRKSYNASQATSTSTSTSSDVIDFKHDTNQPSNAPTSSSLASYEPQLTEAEIDSKVLEAYALLNSDSEESRSAGQAILDNLQAKGLIS